MGTLTAKTAGLLKFREDPLSELRIVPKPLADDKSGTGGPTPGGDASPWVVRFASYVPGDGRVLDLACGGGRNSRFFLGRGQEVVAVDRDLSRIGDLMGFPRFRAIRVDLEDGRSFPLRGQRFAAVIVTNYLHRPILGDLISVVRPGGVFIYETFAHGNEQFGRPSCSEYLLRPGELLEVVRDQLRVIAFEDLVVNDPRPKAVQRIAAVRPHT